MTKIINNYDGLSQAEVDYIKKDAEGMNFDFIRYADDLTVTISPHTPSESDTVAWEFDVLIEGTSDTDERGNGSFGYAYTKELLQHGMELLELQDLL